jgi:alpha-glucosidase
MLWLYRQAFRLRRRERALGDGAMTWLASESTALVFQRGDDLVNVTNLGTEPMPLPEHDRILLASTPLVGGMLPPDSTAWLHRPA